MEDLECSSPECQEEKNRKLITQLILSFRNKLDYYHPYSEVYFLVNANNQTHKFLQVFAVVHKQVEIQNVHLLPSRFPLDGFYWSKA